MKLPAKKITIDVPAAWGEDALSTFLDGAWPSTAPTFSWPSSS